MNKSRYKKDIQLGMPLGTATNRLRKMILFHLLKKHNENFCFQCTKEIETVKELSVEHKKPWLHENVNLFWDIKNIAFSHLSCNVGASKPRPRVMIHGTDTCYHYGCRCNKCKHAERLAKRKYRIKIKNK